MRETLSLAPVPWDEESGLLVDTLILFRSGFYTSRVWPGREGAHTFSKWSMVGMVGRVMCAAMFLVPHIYMETQPCVPVALVQVLCSQ